MSPCLSSRFAVIPMRFERMTYCLEGSCSIQLSYGTLIGRDDKIRTCDLFVPNEARYQAALHPVFLEFAKVQFILISFFRIQFFLLLLQGFMYISSLVMLASNVFINEKADEQMFQWQAMQHQIFVLCDTNTKRYCLPHLTRRLGNISDAHILCVPEGESSKDISSLVQLWQHLIQQQADRDSLLLNVGGGMICDLGGFVACTFKRGIDFVNIPTSLTAQVDAAIGGKTAINFQGIKNQIGSFKQASAVLIYNELLQTLPERHIYAAYAEMMKHALIADASYWKQLITIQSIDSLIRTTSFIEKSIQIKQGIVALDFYDKAQRKILNFGHSIAHVIESFFFGENGKVLHGEAVAWGLLAEAYLSRLKGYLSQNELEEIQIQILKTYQPLSIHNMTEHEWMPLLYMDKKRQGNSFNFTLLKGIGNAIINQSCCIDEIRKALDYISHLY